MLRNGLWHFSKTINQLKMMAAALRWRNQLKPLRLICQNWIKHGIRKWDVYLQPGGRRKRLEGVVYVNLKAGTVHDHVILAKIGNVSTAHNVIACIDYSCLFSHSAISRMGFHTDLVIDDTMVSTRNTALGGNIWEYQEGEVPTLISVLVSFSCLFKIIQPLRDNPEFERRMTSFFTMGEVHILLSISIPQIANGGVQ